MTSEPVRPSPTKHVLFDVDGTLIDAVDNQRRVREMWAERYRLAAAVEEGEPSPVPSVLAAEQLGAEPEDCLVIEDAPSGVEAGLRAGMTVWGTNAAVAVSGVHCHFGSLREGVPDILAFARSKGSAAVE
ncbi:HAD-IA family hydrolase [Streptomyces antimycoticus]|uniref:HAD-IA family hydrolase n=1 Tax=Streptomyces antimycoticus TaxID=68175 RepID=UPI00369C699F